jgi:hypothetical protein
MHPALHARKNAAQTQDGTSEVGIDEVVTLRARIVLGPI